MSETEKHKKNSHPEAPATEGKDKPKKPRKDKEAEKPTALEDRVLEAETRIAAAEAKLADAEAHTAELNERLMRTAAEYDNHRKRSARETESAFKNGVCFSAEELLPVLDTLNAAAGVPTSDEEYKKGVLLTLHKCEEVFLKLGISEIEAEGQPFDPELHNAVMQKPDENAESGTVTLVMQKGYKLGDRVIRHAMVAVAP